MMQQGGPSYRYEREKNEAGMTAMEGLPVCLDMAQVIGLRRSVGEHLGVREAAGQGWRDEQVVLSLILLNLGGGDCVEDWSLPRRF